MAIKELLMDALKEAVAIFNTSGDPDQAIVKVASAHDLNVDQSTRLIELFNTVNALNHYKNAMDKTASFPLANADNIMIELFDPEKLLPSKAASFEEYDYSEYTQAEDGIVVEAEEVLDFTPRVYDDRDINTVIAQGYTAASALEKIAFDCDRNAGMAEVVITKELEKLANQIKKEWQEKGNQVYSELVKCSYFTYGDAVVPYLEVLASYVPNNKLVKCASLVDDRKYAAVLTRLGELIKMGNDSVELRQQAEEIRSEVASFEKEILNAFKPDYKDISFFKSAQSYGDKKEQVNKPAPGGGSFLKSIIPKTVDELSGMVEPTALELRSRTNKDIADTLVGSINADEIRAAKKHEEEMANLERQSILEDLITNDPVLSGIEPEKIVSSYQAIMRLSPEVSRNKEVVRAQLRQLAHSIALSPFDAKQLVDLENVMKRNVGTVKESPVQKG